MAKPKHILIVDDDPGIGEMLKTLLELNDFEATHIEQPDGIEELIKKNKTDLVLLDMLISGVDGTEVCSQLRKDKEVSETPILMMSALHEAGIKCKNSGADDFIAKPFEMEDLLKKIDQVLSRQGVE
ncbi:MAG TPA: response regulator [Salinimicrobium sp.]|nr:response regulator [Salinimicrobium sp.]